jgi:hypothetical protein
MFDKMAMISRGLVLAAQLDGRVTDFAVGHDPLHVQDRREREVLISERLAFSASIPGAEMVTVSFKVDGQEVFVVGVYPAPVASALGLENS